MKRWVISILVLFCATLPWSALSAEEGNLAKKEVEVFVQKAADYLKTQSKEKALKDFSDPKGPFVQGELYLIAMDFEGKMLAHGAKPAMAGMNLLRMKDPNGLDLIVELIKTARQGSGWVNYHWEHPITKKVRPKSTFVVKIDDGLWIGAGIYE